MPVRALLLLAVVAAAGCAEPLEPASRPDRGGAASVAQLDRVVLAEADRAARELARCRRRVVAGALRLHRCTFRTLARAEAAAAVNARLLRQVAAQAHLPPGCAALAGALVADSLALASAAREARTRESGTGWRAVRRATSVALRLARDVRSAARRTTTGGGCRAPPAYPRDRHGTPDRAVTGHQPRLAPPGEHVRAA